jgi:antitoxin component HigA of HigAB toxin-antitoxin module
MDRNYIKESLVTYGYSKSGVDSILSSRRKPMLNSQYELKDRFGIPLEAWRDIKSFITTSSHKNKDLQNV